MNFKRPYHGSVGLGAPHFGHAMAWSDITDPHS